MSRGKRRGGGQLGVLHFVERVAVSVAGGFGGAFGGEFGAASFLSGWLVVLVRGVLAVDSVGMGGGDRDRGRSEGRDGGGGEEKGRGGESHARSL